VTTPAALATLGTTFNRFLYAPIDDDPDATLSVLSALAREGHDAWEYAARLQGMPIQKQVGELSALIAALPPGPAVRPPPNVIASRLILLLPAPSLVKRVRASGTADVAGDSGGHINGLQMLVGAVFFMLLSLWIIGDMSETPAAVSPTRLAQTDAPRSPPSRDPRAPDTP